jgi:hypothetical protein
VGRLPEAQLLGPVLLPGWQPRETGEAHRSWAAAARPLRLTGGGHGGGKAARTHRRGNGLRLRGAEGQRSPGICSPRRCGPSGGDRRQEAGPAVAGGAGEVDEVRGAWAELAVVASWRFGVRTRLSTVRSLRRGQRSSWTPVGARRGGGSGGSAPLRRRREVVLGTEGSTATATGAERCRRGAELDRWTSTASPTSALRGGGGTAQRGEAHPQRRRRVAAREVETRHRGPFDRTDARPRRLLVGRRRVAFIGGDEAAQQPVGALRHPRRGRRRTRAAATGGVVRPLSSALQRAGELDLEGCGRCRVAGAAWSSGWRRAGGRSGGATRNSTERDGEEGRGKYLATRRRIRARYCGTIAAPVGTGMGSGRGRGRGRAQGRNGESGRCAALARSELGSRLTNSTILPKFWEIRRNSKYTEYCS